MQNRRKEIALVAGSIMLGATIASPAASAALTAQQSNQKIFVDGQQVQIEAYSIGGANYVRLRDVGKAVDFGVRYDAQTNTVHIDSTSPYEDENAVKTVALPTDGSKYTPQVGDVLLCDDGTTYEIKNVDRFENNIFAPGPLPDLPEPTCDWSLFPAQELPAPEVRHYVNEVGDNVYVRNLYETRRMQYTLYNAIGRTPESWRDGKPLARVMLTIPAEYEAYTPVFWPWRSVEITDSVHARPNSRYYVDAYDFYHDGVYQYTRYLLLRFRDAENRFRDEEKRTPSSPASVWRTVSTAS